MPSPEAALAQVERLLVGRGAGECSYCGAHRKENGAYIVDHRDDCPLQQLLNHWGLSIENLRPLKRSDEESYEGFMDFIDQELENDA